MGNFNHISNEAKDYAKQLLDIIGEPQGKYFAMLNNPALFRDEWEGVIRFIIETNDEDCHVADEIEEELMEL
mgnify:CR=1 FL=1